MVDFDNFGTFGGIFFIFKTVHVTHVFTYSYMNFVPFIRSIISLKG